MNEGDFYFPSSVFADQQAFRFFSLICLAFVKLEARQVCVAPLYLVWMQDKHSAGTTLKKKEKKLNLKNPQMQ